MAVDDDFLRKNPLAFELASAIVNDSVTREVNTRKQQIDLFEKIRDIRNPAVYSGSRRHQCSLEHIHPCEVRYAEEEVYRIAKD